MTQYSCCHFTSLIWFLNKAILKCSEWVVIVGCDLLLCRSWKWELWKCLLESIDKSLPLAEIKLTAEVCMNCSKEYIKKDLDFDRIYWDLFVHSVLSVHMYVCVFINIISFTQSILSSFTMYLYDININRSYLPDILTRRLNLSVLVIIC